MYSISYLCDNCGCSCSKSYNKGTLAPTTIKCDNCGCVANKVGGSSPPSVPFPPYPKIPKPKPKDYDDWYPDPWDRKRGGPYIKPYRGPYKNPDIWLITKTNIDNSILESYLKGL